MCTLLKIFCCSTLLIVLIEGHGFATRTAPQHGKSVVCYWAMWSSYRPGRGSFKLENVDPTLCTHLILAYAKLDDADNSIKILGDWPDLVLDENNQNNITKLKINYPHLKVLISVGGWQDGSIKYSRMAEDPEKRSLFINDTIDFVTQHDFDGLDIVWTYPAKRGGSLSDKVNFLQLVKELRSKYDEYNLLLTAGIGASKDTIDSGYDMPGLSKYLDLMLVMCYDYHGWWSRNIAANSPLPGPDFLNTEYTIKHLLELGAEPSKLILGVPLYGRTFFMEEAANETGPPPPLDGNFKPNAWFYGNLTQDVEGGSMGYNEICLELYDINLGWKSYWDWFSKTPYAIKDDQLITYDNDRSLIEKTRFAMHNGLGGIMTWSIDTDDFHGDCYEKIDGRTTFPLLRAINKELHEIAMYETDFMIKYNVVEPLAQTDDGLKMKSNFFLLFMLVFLLMMY